MIKYKRISFLVILISLIAFHVNAQKLPAKKEDARVFVQKFYDKYAVWVNDDTFIKKHNASPFAYTFKTQGNYFDKRLYNALNNYFKNPTKDGDIGLDFDPIANAQDLRNGYQTGNVKQNADDFLVDIHDIQGGRTRKQILLAEIAVTVEVKNVNGEWKFVNFIYPSKDGNIDLLTLLKGF